MEAPPVLSAETNPLYAAALAYAARGWRVAPLHQCLPPTAAGEPVSCSCGREGCESQGKHPRLKEWQKVASTDPMKIAEWWRKWPEANVGVALGTVSGIVSIDVDTEAGGKLLKEYAGGKDAKITRTLKYKTGKGWRLLYAIPEGLATPPATHAVQLDGVEAVRFQADGGQCVMPPSAHPSGKRYEWVKECGLEDGALSPMPEWLVLEMCRPKAANWSDQAARSTFLEGKDFNAGADWWRDILAPAGFTQAGRAGDVERYTRPGKKSGVSVTVGHYRANDGTAALYVFSGSIPELEAGRCYDKFGAYARLHHRGDFSRAGAEIKRQGYGKTKATKPEASTSSSTPKDWSEPISLDDPDDELPGFPLEVFPQALADLCTGSAEAVGCPPDYAATHAIAVAAGVAGAAYDLQVKRGFFAPAVVWACVVAPPGSGKSPSVAPILAPLFAKQAERKRSGNDKPVYVGDVTVERLARLLEQDPRGLTMVWDEMAGWLTSFNQYKAKGSGNDRAHYLSIWDGRPLKVDRAGPDKPPLFVQRPRLSIVGGIQPEVLDELRAGPSDGLFDRMLFSYPTDPGLAVETFAEVDEASAAEWARALDWLWERKLRRLPEEDDRPNIILLNDDGRPVWRAWTEDLARDAARPEAPSYFRNVAAKCQGYAARLALVVHLVREAYGERLPLGIGEDDMFRGICLARYFLRHGERVRRASGRDSRLTRARIIYRWIAGRSVKSDQVAGKFTRSDAWAMLRRNTAFNSPDDLDEPLKRLVDHRCIRWAQGGYEINPAVLREAEPFAKA